MGLKKNQMLTGFELIEWNARVLAKPELLESQYLGIVKT